MMGSLRFTLDQLNPAMRAQAEEQLSKMSIFGQVREHHLSDKAPPGWKGREADKIPEKRKIKPAAIPLAPPLTAAEPPPQRAVFPPKRRVRGPDKKPRRKPGELAGTPKEKQRTRRASDLERDLAFQIDLFGLPAPVGEYVFLPRRKFRFDFAWPELRKAIEVQGMVHRIKSRFEADIEKRALALLAGWSVLEVSGASIRDGRAIEWVKEFLK